MVDFGNNLPPPTEGHCLMCGKDREVIDVGIHDPLQESLAPSYGICDSCSYLLREEWNIAKRLRVPALDSKIATTYVVIPRLIPSRSELDVSGYEFVTVSGGWPSTAFLSRDLLVKWLRETFRIVTWPGGILRIYAGFDEHARFAEVVLLTIWGQDYEKTGRVVDLKWSNFDSLLTPPTVRGAFAIGAKAGFEGYLLRRELAPAATGECIVLGEPALRYLAVKQGIDKDPVWSNEAMLEAYFKAMPERERLVVGQPLSEQQVAPPIKAEIVREVSPRMTKPSVEAVQQDLEFEDDEGSAEVVSPLSPEK